MKQLKIIGAEVLFLTISVAVAVVCAYVQFIGRIHKGDYSNIIFAGSNFTYNIIFYLLGLVLFVGIMTAGYKLYLKNRIKDLKGANVGFKILFAAVACLFAFAMLVGLAFALFLILGLNDNMSPKLLFNITGFGWPIFCLVFMLAIEVLICRNSEAAEGNSI